jgi:type VI protein secretion system component VasK
MMVVVRFAFSRSFFLICTAVTAAICTWSSVHGRHCTRKKKERKRKEEKKTRERKKTVDVGRAVMVQRRKKKNKQNRSRNALYY